MKLIENVIMQVELDYTDEGIFKTARIKKVFATKRTNSTDKVKKELGGVDVGQIEL